MKHSKKQIKGGMGFNRVVDFLCYLPLFPNPYYAGLLGSPFVS